ncbi:hypothetical protein JCM11251_004983 [Rhodosporidiobolus azoricus]
MGRRKQQPEPSPTIHNPFRTAERLWKKSNPPPLELAFDPSRIIWETIETDGRLHGVWASGDGSVVECWRVRLGDLAESGMGQSRWKGKEREGEGDYAVVVPRIPGLVLFPRILPDSLQRSLVAETLQHARRPNLTVLDNAYQLPPKGLWNAWVAGKGEEVVPAIPAPKEEQNGGEREGTPASSTGYDTPSTDAGSGMEDGKADRLLERALSRTREVTVRELLPKMRWANVGWYYNWTSKLYEFERGHIPLPPVILRCCRDLVRKTPWRQVFLDSSTSDSGSYGGTSSEDWRKWKEDYEPDAGLVNFYQIKDSLTAHQDVAEVDAVRPLVSFSLGHSSVFLVGGTTKEEPPLAILLRSGDGVCMSGPSRRAYHGLPRVLSGTLPSFLSSTQPEPVETVDDWRPYGEYLERGARINVNVRSVY